MNKLPPFYSIILLIFISSQAFAQKAPIKFGDVSKEEIDMKSYEADPDADAVVLCDYGFLSFKYDMNKGWKNELRRICRIKIFNDNGYKWATTQLSLYDDNNVEQSISQIKGYTYNIVKGKVEKTKLGKDNIFREKTSKNRYSVKFTLPNVKEGAIIEFSYSIHSNYITILDPWKFQWSIPVKWSEYLVQIPEYLTYIQNSQGYGRFYKYEADTRSNALIWTESTHSNINFNSSGGGGMSNHKISYRDDVFHWIAKDLPALKDEAFVGNYKNFLLGVDFQLSNYRTFSDKNQRVLSNWSKVVDKFLHDYEDFGPNMHARNFYKDITENIMSKYSKPEQRIAAVYDFVSQYMKWNGKNDIIPNRNIKASFGDRTGTVADINALLVSMLRAVEIEADPVIISTVSHGLVHPTMPMLDKYNYLIAKANIGDKYVLLDATEKNIPFGMLPYRDLNQRGYAISEKNPGWVNQHPAHGMENTIVCMFTMLPDGTLEGNISNKKSGYSALNERKAIKKDGQDKFIENLKSKHPSWTINKVDIDNPKDVGQPVKEKIDLKITDAAEAMGSTIYFNPMIRGKIEENPLKQEERLLPIDFMVPMKNTYMFNLMLPEGYVVDEVPEPISIATPDHTASFRYAVKVMGNRLQLMSTWQIRKSFYAPDKFQALKEFYASIVDKHAGQIVLKKAPTN